MAKIKHLIVLMMENRSFDHVFGFLKSNAYPINGLNGTETNPDSAGTQIRVSPDARFTGDLSADPGHDFIDVNEQIFSNSQGTPGLATPMTGFVKNYESKTNNLKRSGRVMKCFKPGRLPILTTLAKEFAICDNWYASVPGPTLPNRAFAYGATSQGRLDMSPEYLDLKTVFELLDQHGVSSRIYHHNLPSVILNGFLLKNSSKFLFSFDNFADDCKNNRLPAYSLLEPRYDDLSRPGEFFPATDQHPDHSMVEGERLIRRVYDALRANQATWESSMLVVTYDEHGGLYDHVLPPKTQNPDNKTSKAPPFDFTRLGVRVPAVVVSPYIPRGTIFGSRPNVRVFDHTSLIATARKLFIPNHQNHWLTERDRNANTFDDLLTLSTPRTDVVSFSASGPVADAAPLENLVVAEMAMAEPPKKSKKEKPPSEFQAARVLQAHTLESALPPKAQSGIAISSIKTEREASAFLAWVQEKIDGGELDLSKLQL